MSRGQLPTLRWCMAPAGLEGVKAGCHGYGFWQMIPLRGGSGEVAGSTGSWHVVVSRWLGDYDWARV